MIKFNLFAFLSLALPCIMVSNISAQDASESNQQIIQEYEQWSAMRDDWANLGHFREANEHLEPVQQGSQRVVMMGNSITAGWSGNFPEFFEGKPYINRGISGQTTPQMLVRFRQDVVNLNPDVVVILAGTNDIAGNTGPSSLDMIAHNIYSMAEIAKANGIKVILSSVLPVYDYPWKPGLEPADKIISLNETIKSFSEENGIFYLDYFTAVVDEQNGMKDNLAYDGVHPTEEGYRVMSGLAEEAIRQVLKD
ncbi:MAG: SGNH/GDSL hydrolase family protein [Balneolales bacterium]